MTKIKPLPLDYEITQDVYSREWQVWTPDMTGGVIGSGSTREEAIQNARKNLTATVISLFKELRKT